MHSCKSITLPSLSLLFPSRWFYKEATTSQSARSRDADRLGGSLFASTSLLLFFFTDTQTLAVYVCPENRLKPEGEPREFFTSCIYTPYHWVPLPLSLPCAKACRRARKRGTTHQASQITTISLQPDLARFRKRGASNAAGDTLPLSLSTFSIFLFISLFFCPPTVSKLILRPPFIQLGNGYYIQIHPLFDTRNRPSIDSLPRKRSNPPNLFLTKFLQSRGIIYTPPFLPAIFHRREISGNHPAFCSSAGGQIIIGFCLSPRGGD